MIIRKIEWLWWRQILFIYFLESESLCSIEMQVQWYIVSICLTRLYTDATNSSGIWFIKNKQQKDESPSYGAFEKVPRTSKNTENTSLRTEVPDFQNLRFQNISSIFSIWKQSILQLCSSHPVSSRGNG